MTKEVFHMLPAGGQAMVFFGAFSLLIVLLGGLLLVMVYSARHTSIEVTDDGLRIRGNLYGRFIPIESIDTAGATKWNLDRGYRLRPVTRTNGIGLPGYAAGWFHLYNKEKALAFLTDQSRIVYIPTTLGFSVMVSVEDPDSLVRALRKAAAGADEGSGED